MVTADNRAEDHTHDVPRLVAVVTIPRDAKPAYELPAARVVANWLTLLFDTEASREVVVASIDEAGVWSSAEHGVASTFGAVFGARYVPTAWHHPLGRSVAVAEDVALLIGGTIQAIADDEEPGGRDGVEVVF